jgi:hypothetical protein
VTQLVPIFTPEFVRKVKFDNRQLISQIELHYYLDNPDIAKLLQQTRWFKRLNAFTDPGALEPTRINLSTYKSIWLKIHRLLEMGIGYFLRPDASWTDTTPEAIAFWERGKSSRTSQFINVSVGSSKPCEYIGRVLKTLDIKTQSRRVKTASGERQRVYSLNAEHLNQPDRKAIYEAVKHRIKASINEEDTQRDWNSIVRRIEAQTALQAENNPVEFSPILEAEPLTVEAQNRVHLPPVNSINLSGGGHTPEGVEGIRVGRMIKHISKSRKDTIHRIAKVDVKEGWFECPNRVWGSFREFQSGGWVLMEG